LASKLLLPEEFANMIYKKQINVSKFFIAGINYKKTEGSIRGQFSINSNQYENILALAPTKGITELFILSTCNRTEIYGLAEDVSPLIELLCSNTAGSIDTFQRVCYVKQGTDAVQHLFEVGAGLDSQILGDYEIIGQIKSAVKIAKQKGFIGGFTERLVNTVLQSAKVIKNHTALSCGTVSVSFAAVQYIKKTLGSIKDKKVSLVGTGKIGGNTCKNLVDYLDATNITLINRTEEKAVHLAKALGLRHASFGELHEYIASSDIILVATGCDTPILLKSHLAENKKKLIIDLSIPYNVEKDVQQLSNITLVNVDDLSKMQDETLEKRLAEVPKAKKIIAEHIAHFFEWNEARRHAPVIKAVKQKLCEMYELNGKDISCNFLEESKSKIAIDQAVKNIAIKMRIVDRPGCLYIEAVNDFLTNNGEAARTKLSA
jgi:glutamyl-tRNA reductase